LTENLDRIIIFPVR